MPVHKKQVLATAALCRLDLSVASAHAPTENVEKRMARIASQLDSIVGYMDILNQVDTSNVEPLYSPLQHTMASPRPDRIEQHLTREEILANAPVQRQGFFVVPPAIG